VLGYDFSGKKNGVTYGDFGYTRFPEFTLPMLKRFGFGEDIITKLTVENPARILAY